MKSYLAAAVLAAAIGASGCTHRMTGDDILARVTPHHPRLMMTSDTIATIKMAVGADPWLAARYERQKNRADRFLAEPPSQYVLEATDRDRLLDTTRRVLDRVTTLALFYRLEGDRRYLDRCWVELEAAARFRDWDPEDFLGTANMTAAFAIGYDWLYEAWSAGQRQTVRHALVELGLKPGLAAYHSGRRWVRWKDNWNIHCNAGLALGALAIADELPDVAGEVLAYGRNLVPNALSQFAPDGAWAEGPMYWENATLFAAMYLDSLRTACGTDFGLGTNPGLDQSGWFPAYLNGPANGAFNFADALEDSEPRSGPQFFWLARRFHEPRYAQYEMDHADGRIPALELIWGSGVEHTAWQTIPTDRYFRGVEVVAARDRWDDRRAWFFGFRAGSNTVGHAHLDAGSFVLDAKGVRWAIDLGPDDYGLPGYSDDDDKGQRWNYYRLRAEGHNTLVINPGNGPDQNRKGTGKIVSFASMPQGVKLTADLSPVYPDADRVVRALSFRRGQGVEVTDSIKLRRKGDVWWFLQTRAAARSTADGRTLELKQDGQTLAIELLQPTSARFEVGPSEPLPSSPHPRKQAVNNGVSRISIHLTEVDHVEIAVLFE